MSYRLTIRKVSVAKASTLFGTHRNRYVSTLSDRSRIIQMLLFIRSKYYIVSMSVLFVSIRIASQLTWMLPSEQSVVAMPRGLIRVVDRV